MAPAEEKEKTVVVEEKLYHNYLFCSTGKLHFFGLYSEIKFSSALVFLLNFSDTTCLTEFYPKHIVAMIMVCMKKKLSEFRSGPSAVYL